MDYFNAHLVLEGMDWQLVDAKYEESDGRTTVTRLIHVFNGNEALVAVATEDQTLGLDFVDFYGKSADVIEAAAEQLEGYTETELQNAAEQAQTPGELQALLLKLGVTALTHNSAWKQAFIEGHIRQGPRETRLAALLAATLAVNPVFLPSMQAASQDEDPEIQAYSAGLLRVLNSGGDPLRGPASAPASEDIAGAEQRGEPPSAETLTQRRRALIQAALTAPVEEAAFWVSPLVKGTAESQQANAWRRPRRRVLLKTEAWSASLFLRAGDWAVMDWESEEGDQTLAARYVYVSAGDPNIWAEVIQTLGLTFVDFHGDDEDEINRGIGLLEGVYTEDELREVAEHATLGAELNEALLQLGITAATVNPSWKRSFIDGHLNFAPAEQRKAAMLAATFSMDPVFLPAIENAAEDANGVGEDFNVRSLARALLDVWAARRLT
ncbi:hypothetical protein GO986_17405 [Deinococcus sp. HMF7620]|uniref:Uncharacterized protein n=1 Tax=Deinococcus arboris TaxID=2682977 RepID=A0A7C9LWP6_9DEIO|nr:hypothetical protein [Deinococcus arboris]MVN88520.1 hypothetical protein [Deinococcus arboris]